MTQNSQVLITILGKLLAEILLAVKLLVMSLFGKVLSLDFI